MCTSDKERLEALLVSKYDKMNNYLERNFHFPHVDKEDVLQQAFMAAHNNLHMLREEEKMEGWLTRIVYHTALNYKKAEERIAGRIVDLEGDDYPFPC